MICVILIFSVCENDDKDNKDKDTIFALISVQQRAAGDNLSSC